MKTSLLDTKLFIPSLRPEFITRTRLLNLIEAGLQGKLTLISAPAGFGKSTLVSMWARKSKTILGWVSLDHQDNDPVLFLTYIFTAIYSVGQVGDSVLAEIQSSQRPSDEAILRAWINELAKHPSKLVLVLDDYHVIETPAIHKHIEFLLEHLPPNFHLIVITRSDPNLQLARLRASGHLTEIREANLRFTESEATEFLENVMGLQLSTENCSALKHRTEGWAVGLQLAGLALKGRHNVDEFIAAFTGGHQFILDYLTEEVFERQSDEIKEFLLQTSILDRMCPALCNDVTLKLNGDTMLRALNRKNLFVVPIDDKRQWYRYHQLFADLLRYKLEKIHPEHLNELHRRAGAWYAENDFTSDALQHYLTAGDSDTSADLIEAASPNMIGLGKLLEVQRWIESLPEAVIKSRPYLCLYHAWVLNLTNQTSLLEMRLQDTVRVIAAISFDQHTINDINGQIAAIRAYDARRRKDLPLSIDYLHEALKLIPEDNPRARSAALYHLGLTHMHQGRLTAAAEALSEARGLGEPGGNPYVTLATTGSLADIYVAQGYLQRAKQLCSHTIDDFLARYPNESLSALGYVFVSLGKILYEWNEMEQASTNLEKGIAFAEQTANWRAMLEGMFALAWLRQMQGQLDETAILLEKADGISDRARQSFREMERDAWQARSALAQNKLTSANRWAKHYQAEKMKLGSAHEFSDGVLARVLIAQKKFSQALELSESQCQRLKAIGANGQLVETLMLKALALQGKKEIDFTMTTLEQALFLAEAGGFVRTFIDEGTPMVALLTEFLNWSGGELVTSGYVKNLLAAFPEEQIQAYQIPFVHTQTPEILSDREQQILGLLAAGKKTPEIAAELFLSNNTIKWYLKNIYSKLDVHTRADAIERGRQLDLIS